MKIKIVALLALAVLLSADAYAHQYWIEPETFFPAANQPTAVHLYVGAGLTKEREERPFQLLKTEVFRLFSSSEALDLKGTVANGSLPVYNFSAGRAGTYLLAMERNWSYIKLAPKEFEEYLREDGMEYVIAERARLGEGGREGRERYSRFLKSLLQVGGARDETFKKTVGARLEITPLENPYSKRVGDRLSFKITFDGRPLAGKTVFADNRGGESQRMTTDRGGKFAMKLERGGLWLVRLVFMRRCASACGEADWESFWGAYSFGAS